MNGRQVNSVSLATVVRDTASVTIGLLSLAVRAVEQHLHPPPANITGLPQAPIPRQRTWGDAETVIDTVIGGAMLVARGTATAAFVGARTAQALTRPVTSRIAVDGLINTPRMRALTDLGEQGRSVAEVEAGLVSRRLIGGIVLLVLDQLDLTHEVLARVDLDAIVKSVDLDAAVSRVDLDAVVSQVDLNRAVRGVDLDSIVDQVNLDRAVRRVDLDGIIATVDIDAVLNRVDLVGVAGDIIAALDLPEIIRGSSGSLATEMVRDARVQSMAADEAVNRVVDRLLLRRRRPRTTPLDESPDQPPE
jgi:hypothetical protein